MRIFYLETIEKNGFSGSLFPLGQNLHGGSSSGKEMRLRKTREESELVIFFFLFVFFSSCSQPYSPSQNGGYRVTPRLVHSGSEEGPVRVTETGV